MYFAILSFYFFNAPATTEIYTLSLHDALPISRARGRADVESTGGTPVERPQGLPARPGGTRRPHRADALAGARRSEEHTSELQSRENLVCRLLLEKKKKKNYARPNNERKTRQS